MADLRRFAKTDRAGWRIYGGSLKQIELDGGFDIILSLTGIMKFNQRQGTGSASFQALDIDQISWKKVIKTA